MLSFIDTDLKKVILWQYENAEKLKALVISQDQWHRENNKGFYQKWHDDFFNIDTANDWGLKLWARILGIPLAVHFEPQSEKVSFGVGGKRKNFKGNFGSRGGGKVSFSSDQLRLMIKMRYFRLTNQPTVYNINKFLKDNIKDGAMYVIDNHDMTFAYYILEFMPDPAFKFLLDEMGFLPRPCGVGVRYSVIEEGSFGFGEYRENFYESNFASSGVIDG